MNKENELIISVCDMLTGAGKTSAAISRMNEDVESNYIFITPYRAETQRIKDACPSRDFYLPKNKGKGKLKNLEQLLLQRRNIASTHALFQNYTDKTISLIREGNYKLILDEAFDVVEQIKIHKHDIQMLFRDKKIEYCDENQEQVRWIDKEYKGDAFRKLKEKIEDGNVVYYSNELMLWNFPIEAFKAFKDVIILTYLFESQVQKYYYDLNNIQIKYIGTAQDKQTGNYYFTDNIVQPDHAKYLINKIHILDDEKLNAIGEKENALSSSWYDREMDKTRQPLISLLKNNLNNALRHKFDCSSKTCIWTTFEKARPKLSGGGYTKGFVQWNCRATNEYRDRYHVAYCVNVYMLPTLKNYFLSHGVTVLEDDYALSEMIQFIFRSAIRENKDIWIYIPSSRMRYLLMDWLKELSK